jgi:hypothetical protein
MKVEGRGIPARGGRIWGPLDWSVGWLVGFIAMYGGVHQSFVSRSYVKTGIAGVPYARLN